MKSKLLIILSLALAIQTYAGSATWNLNPTSNDWNTAANWTPATVPNSSSDVATFGVSNTTSIAVTRFDYTSANIVFNPGASAFTITAPGDSGLDFGSTGITNNSGITQNFAAGPGGDDTSELTFQGNATAGSGTVFTAYGGTSSVTTNAISFSGGDAGTATFHATGGVSGGEGGLVALSDGTLGAGTADSGTFIIDGAAGNNFHAGAFARIDSSVTPPTTAGNATFTINGAPNAGGSGGTLEFGTFTNSHPTAGNATLIANGGTGGGPGGAIMFNDSSTGGTARTELFGNGHLDIRYIQATSLAIGSIEGTGSVILGAKNLSVGGNNLSTVFSGTISGASGSITKVGMGKLTLTNANSYVGGTIVTAGTLFVSNSTGSATGTGPVQVTAGTLGGGGTVAGAVNLGTGSGMGAFLAPAAGTKVQATLTIQSGLTFNTDSTYTYTFKAKGNKAKTDKVVANGVTINNGATFNFSGTAQGTLAQGLVLAAISNTAATPIAGSFANPADGAILTVGANHFQASYEGGDGNDLTLTVVP